MQQKNEAHIPCVNQTPIRRKISWPDYLKPSDEGTHALMEVPGWSENYLTQAYAPEAKIGFWFHLGRTPFDQQLWNEIFIAYLPGDQFLVSNGYSYGDSPTGPIGNQLHYRCDKPFEQWTKSFRGAATLVTGEQLRKGAFAAGLHVAVDVELVCEGMGPVFDLGSHSDNDSWSKVHYEQHSRVRGYICYDGQRFELAGSGIRDHSWGPRDLTRLDCHNWVTAQFPSGRTLVVWCIKEFDKEVGTIALMGDGQSVRKCRLVTAPPMLAEGGPADAPYSFVLAGDDGRETTVRANILQIGPMSIGGINELLMGSPPMPTAHHRLLEAQTRFEWEGEIGYGLTDRGFPLRGAGAK